MRHLDASALTHLIGAMADVVGSLALPSVLLPEELPAPLTAALAAFDAGWAAPATPAMATLTTRVERLAAAGMAFMEGDPMTAGQLLAVPIDGDATTRDASLPVGEVTVAGRVAELQAVAAAAEGVAADLTARQLARRAPSGAGRSIAAFRAFAVGHREAADALTAYLTVAGAVDERRRLVEELLGDATPVPAQAQAGHVARLHDKAMTVDDEASASMIRCVASITAAIPGPPALAAAYDGLDRAVDAVHLMLSEAAASEGGDAVGRADRSAPVDPRPVV